MKSRWGSTSGIFLCKHVRFPKWSLLNICLYAKKLPIYSNLPSKTERRVHNFFKSTSVSQSVPMERSIWCSLQKTYVSNITSIIVEEVRLYSCISLLFGGRFSEIQFYAFFEIDLCIFSLSYESRKETVWVLSIYPKCE